LPDTEDPTSRANAVSADGKVVVGTNFSSAGFQAFRWSAETGMVGLGFLPGLTDSEAFEVSANGDVIVGASSSPAGRAAFRWTAGTGMQFLSSAPANVVAAFARAVSADGSVVVGAGNGETGQEAFRWSTTGGMAGLGFISGATGSSIAEGVSADGSVVVGISSLEPPPNSNAFRWIAAAGMVGLPLLEGAQGGNAEAISADASVIVGNSNFVSAGPLVPQATKWTETSGAVGLGFLPGFTAGSIAFAVSGDGSIIVGTSESSDGAEAFLWNPNEGMRGLRDLLVSEGLGLSLVGWKLLTATGVSADGSVIVGRGINPGGSVEAFIASVGTTPPTPLPAVGSWGMIILGLVFVGAMARILRAPMSLV
jgi:probable HAF family extracellular repeat protein